MCEKKSVFGKKLKSRHSVHVHSSDLRIRVDLSKTASSRSITLQNELDTMDSLHLADFFGYLYNGCAITSQTAG